MRLFDQKDMDRIKRCMEQGRKRTFTKEDRAGGVTATVSVGPAGPVWKEQSGVTTLATLKIERLHHGGMFQHFSKVEELWAAIRENGL